VGAEIRFTPSDIERIRQSLPPRTTPANPAPAPEPAPRPEEADTTGVTPSRMKTYFVSKPDPIEPEDGLSIAVPIRRPPPAQAASQPQAATQPAAQSEPPPIPAVDVPIAGDFPADQPADEPAPRRTFRREIPLPADGLQQLAPQQPSAEQPPADQPAAHAGGEQEPEIVVQVTPGGLIISSEDLDALDAFERLLSEFSTTAQGGKEFTVFSLRHARAETAAVLLQEMLTGGVGMNDEFGGGGNLMGELAANMLGGSGGIMGALLGGAGGDGGGTGVITAGTATITPDPRLNLLYVNGTYRDLDTIEQLLQVIDQPENPDALQMQKPPRFIPIENGNAQDIANIVKQVYATRIAADSNQQRQPSPEDFIRALRGGGRSSRGGGGGQQSRGEEQKMTIGVDPASNSLIVAAPDYLFNEVREFVMAIDTAAVRPDETTRVVQIKRASSALMQQSLKSRLGPSATINVAGSTTTTGTTTSTTPTTSTSSTSSQTSSTSGDRSRSSDDADRTRRQMEFFNQLQQSRGGDRGGGDRGSSSRSFGGFGGFPNGGFGGGFPGSSGFSGRGFGGDSGRGSFGGSSRGGSDRGRGDSGRSRGR
jgi:hypothetical protein